MKKGVVQRILGAAVAAAVIWDVYLATDREKENTISAVTRAVAKVPVVSFAIGFVAGHLFWPQKEKIEVTIKPE